MRWRWVTISEDLNLVLTMEGDDPALVHMVETSATANNITLVRLDEGDEEGGIGVREPRRPLPESPGNAVALEEG